VRRQAPACLEDLSGWANPVMGDMLSEVTRLDERIDAHDRHVVQRARQDARAQQLMQLPGVGVTTATALLAMIGNGHDFKCGRQFAAWLGLTPSQYSSGGKARLGHITKAGARTCAHCWSWGREPRLNRAKNKTDAMSQWATAVAERRGYWRAIVAIAAKNARMAWACLALGERFALPA